MRPFFSVIIPVFNRAHKLPAALESVLAQREQDFEVLVIDDGSSDDPGSVIACLADPRVLCIRQDHRGAAAARNLGIASARGRFVAFLDSDDRFLPEHLATMRRLLEHTQDTAAYASVVVNRGAGASFTKPPRSLGPCEHMAEYLLCDRGFVPTITLVHAAATAADV